MVGINVGGTITRSYWDKTTSKLKQNSGGVGLSASKLRSQSAQDNDLNKPYYKWSTANWDFGTAKQYPILKYATGSDPENPACGSKQALPNCGALLLGQHASLERILFSEPVDLSPTFKPTELNYQLNISRRITQLQLTPIASNPDSTIRISKNGVMLDDSIATTGSSVITLDENTSITIEVSAPNQRPAQYRFTVNYRHAITVLGIPNEPIDEGELIILDAFHSLDVPEEQISYRWTQTVGKAVLSRTDNEVPALFLSIPENYIAMIEDDAELGLNIEITDGKTTLNKNINLTIVKKDNGSIRVGSPNLSFLELTAPEIDLSEDPDGAGKHFGYQWQHRPPGVDPEWTNLSGATEQTYTIPILAKWHTEYRVLIGYTDGQGYKTIEPGEAIRYSLETAFQGLLKGSASEESYPEYPEDAKPQRAPSSVFDCTNEDIDDDDDGLIEICDLEGLNAIRYQLDGSGYRANRSATKTTMGCAEGSTERCIGYELTSNLDFNESASYRNAEENKSGWTTGAGWQPIGNASSNAFRATFNGNGYTISNLMINRPSTSYVGLFGYIGGEARIANVGLLNANITVISSSYVGSLVAYNDNAIITNSYATGNVTEPPNPSNSDSYVGGLVGRNRAGTISNSYASVEIVGNSSGDASHHRYYYVGRISGL